MRRFPYPLLYTNSTTPPLNDGCIEALSSVNDFVRPEGIRYCFFVPRQSLYVTDFLSTGLITTYILASSHVVHNKNISIL